ncbi:MAG: hypothetical protein ACFB4J_06400 [Elainellaceae cyanobacterium]
MCTLCSVSQRLSQRRRSPLEADLGRSLSLTDHFSRTIYLKSKQLTPEQASAEVGKDNE